MATRATHLPRGRGRPWHPELCPFWHHMPYRWSRLPAAASVGFLYAGPSLFLRFLRLQCN